MFTFLPSVGNLNLGNDEVYRLCEGPGIESGFDFASYKAPENILSTNATRTAVYCKR
jgi:hypothetical protein